MSIAPPPGSRTKYTSKWFRSFDPNPFVGLVGEKINSGETIDVVSLHSSTDPFDLPTGGRAARNAAPLRRHRICRNQITCAAIAKLILQISSNLAGQDVGGDMRVAKMQNADRFKLPAGTYLRQRREKIRERRRVFDRAARSSLR